MRVSGTRGRVVGPGAETDGSGQLGWGIEIKQAARLVEAASLMQHALLMQRNARILTARLGSSP